MKDKQLKVCVLMPWGRVGSNLMMAYLRSILKGRFANEPLNSIKSAPDQALYLREFFQEKSLSEDMCLKITIRSIKNLPEVVNILNEEGVYVIKMFRKDHVKTVVSQIRAEKYAKKTKEETGAAKWAVRKLDEPLPSTMIELPLLRHRIKVVEGDQAVLEQVEFLSSINIFYEDIVQNVFAVFSKVSNFLDLPFNEEFKIPFRKATPDDLSRAIINVDEINEWLEANGYRIIEKSK